MQVESNSTVPTLQGGEEEEEEAEAETKVAAVKRTSKTREKRDLGEEKGVG